METNFNERKCNVKLRLKFPADAKRNFTSINSKNIATLCISVAGERTIERNRERCYTIISMLFPWAPLRFVSPARSPASPALSLLPLYVYYKTKIYLRRTKGNNRDTGFPPISPARQKH